MKIVVEGMDGAGKDTFIKRLLNELEKEGIVGISAKTPVYPFNQVRETFDNSFSLERFLFYFTGNIYADRIAEEEKNEVLVFNRFFYSTVAYGLFFANRKEKDIIFSVVDIVSINKDVVYIFLKPSLNSIIKRLRKRAEQVCDKKIENIFVSNPKLATSFYNFFYTELPPKVIPKLGREYYVFPNDCLKDLENSIESVKIILKNALKDFSDKKL